MGLYVSKLRSFQNLRFACYIADFLFRFYYLPIVKTVLRPFVSSIINFIQ